MAEEIAALESQLQSSQTQAQGLYSANGLDGLLSDQIKDMTSPFDNLLESLQTANTLQPTAVDFGVGLDDADISLGAFDLTSLQAAVQDLNGPTAAAATASQPSDAAEAEPTAEKKANTLEAAGVVDTLDFGFGVSVAKPRAALVAQGNRVGQKEKKNVVEENINYDEYLLDTYIGLHLNQYWTQITRKRKAIDPKVITGWQRAPIPVGLHMLAERENSQAVVVFQEMLKYMGDRAVKKQNPLEMAQAIIQYGCSNPAIRDEIYLQLMKQTTRNPSKKSVAKGWELIVLCSACFAPSEAFVKYVRAYIHETESAPTQAPNTKGSAKNPAVDAVVVNLAKIAHKQLRRTMVNGARRHPVNGMELESIITGKPIFVKIHLVTGVAKTLLIDSATTASEVTAVLPEKIAMECENHGFTIVVEMTGSTYALSPADHILDALTLFELEEAERKNKALEDPDAEEYSEGVFQLHFRKRLFVENDEANEDQVACDLTYHDLLPLYLQGYYPASQEEMAKLAACIWLADFGGQGRDQLDALLPNLVPAPTALRSQFQAPQMWEAYAAMEHLSPHEVKKAFLEIFEQWQLFGSSVFQATQAFCFTIPQILNVHANHSGLYFCSPPTEENAAAPLRFYPYARLGFSSWKAEGRKVSIEATDANGKEELMEFEVNHECLARDFISLVNDYVGILKKKSMNCRARVAQEEDSFDSEVLPFKRGDYIIILDKDEKDDSGWYQGTLGERTGWFPASSVEILLAPPDANAILREQEDEEEEEDLSAVVEGDHDSDYLKEQFVSFANAHFQDKKVGAVKRFSKKKIELHYRHQKTPIKRALLPTKSNVLNRLAVAVFKAILNYLGDYKERKDHRKPVALIRDIVQPGIKHPELRSEIFAQLCKQSFDNPSEEATKEVWVLIALTLGCFPPSLLFLPTLKSFLSGYAQDPSTDIGKIAQFAIKQMQRTLKKGPRSEPPVPMEIEAVKEVRPMLVRVEFPDSSKKAVFIDSSTTGKEMIQDLSEKYDLRDHDGFGLVSVMSDDNEFSIIDTDKVVDVVSKSYMYEVKLLDEVSSEEMNADHTMSFRFKKLFFSVENSDPKSVILLYHQLAPKHAAGHFPADIQQCVELAALMYRVDYGEQVVDNFDEILPQYIPEVTFRLHRPDHWRGLLLQVHSTQKGKSQNEARIDFLHYLRRWPQFGIHMFNVTQVHNKKLPHNITIGVDETGVRLMNANNKMELLHIPYSAISTWTPGPHSFSINYGNALERRHFACSTPYGETVADLIATNIRRLVALDKTEKAKKAAAAASSRDARMLERMKKEKKI